MKLTIVIILALAIMANSIAIMLLNKRIYKINKRIYKINKSLQLLRYDLSENITVDIPNFMKNNIRRIK